LKIFLDSSVVLAACGRATGASRRIITIAPLSGWTFLMSPYVIAEVDKNVVKLGTLATDYWALHKPLIACVPDVFVFDKPVIFTLAKDRPVLFTASLCADTLLTLDRHDFRELLGSSFYGLQILKPGDWLQRYISS
jgi:hypothetical protein